ncbi:MAG: hypothetical protein G8345_00030 [Magnetococcales bacterium]|nr:hypothetical protein [Magnetococcales bacterium]
MMNNPELQRHVWVELNWHRLLVTFGVMTLAFLLTWFFDEYSFGDTTQTIAMTTFVIANYFYGSHMVGSSLVQEVLGHTWDYQRLSTQSAWSLTWGKIIGSTLYIWLVSGIALLFILLSLDRQQAANWGGVGWYVFKLVGIGLALHGLSLLVSLATVRKNTQISKRHSTGVQLLFFFIFLPIYMPLEMAVAHKQSMVQWYGHPWPLALFILFCVLLTLLWSWIGAWRLMGEELQLRQLPWLWGAFTLFAAFFVGGIHLQPDDASHWHSFFSQGLWMVMFLTYGAAFLAGKDPLLFRRLSQNWSSGWRVRLLVTPPWMISLALAALWLVCVLFTTSRSPWQLPWQMPDYGPDMDLLIWLDSKSIALSLFAFMVRDLLVMAWINVHSRIRRNDAAIMAYLLVVYLLLPSFAHITHAKQIVVLFYPQSGMPMASIVAALVQAVLAAGVLFFTQRRSWQTTS